MKNFTWSSLISRNTPNALTFINSFSFLTKAQHSSSRIKLLGVGIIFLLFAQTLTAQIAPNEAEWNGSGYSLKKVVSNVAIQSGVNFSYTILFTAPAGVSTVTIQDIVPTSLDIVSVPTPSNVSGVTPSVTISGQTVTYSLSSLPTGTAHSGSFTIVVRFPPGITCDGESARNRVGILIGDQWEYTPYAYYYCDIEVEYPAASFPNGSIVNNQTTLSGITCLQQATHTSNQTCIEVADIVQNPSGYFKKYLSLTNRVSGCQGYYNIVFCNNGNVPLSAFNLDDVIPSGISVSSVKVYGGDATTTMSLSANSGGNVIASSISSNYFDSGPLAFTVNDLQLQMTGSLPVGDCINLLIYFDIEPNPTGTVITNCADFDGLSNGLTLPQTCVSFTVEEGEPKPCLNKDICSPQSSYEPGDIVRFRLRVQNIGSADLLAGSIQDVLNSNFTYVGNESYYVGSTYNPLCSSGGGLPSGTSAWSGVSPSHSGNNLSWNIPDIAADCQLFYVAYCGYYGTYGLPYYFIEFDVEVSDTALPGVTPNEFEINGSNLSSTVSSNNVNVLVVASFGQETEKLVSTDNGTNYAASGSVAPGGTARYRLSYKNTSNVPVSSIQLVDLLPRDDGTNDWLILNRAAPRGSQFDLAYAANHSTSLLPVSTAPSPAIDFAPGQNICLPAFGVSAGCTTSSWAATPDQNIRMDYSTFSLIPASSLLEDFDVTIPATASNQQTVCNDFAALATADFLLDGTPQSVALTPIAAPPVCLTVDSTLTSANCCDSISVVEIEGECCVRIVSHCEVKSVEVKVTNGTISSANWNCGTLPAGYAGQSNYTFAANDCALEMTTCFAADQSGVVSVTYIITLSNGETCEETIEMDCKLSACCEAIKVEEVEGDDCCSRLVSECEVDSVRVNVTNGTLSTSSLLMGQTENLFEFINLYPNPTDGRFNITYATSDTKKVSIKVIDNTGQVLMQKQAKSAHAGIHEETLEESRLSSGVYHVILISEDGKTRSKSYVKK